MSQDTTVPVKKDRLTISINVLKAFFFLFLAFMLALLIYYNLVDSAGVVEPEQITYLENWIVTDCDGNTSVINKQYYRADNPYKGEFTITTTLPAEIRDNSVLCFALFGDAYIYIDDELRKTVSQYDDVLLPGGQAKRFITTMPISSSDSGKQLKMVKRNPSKHPEVISNTFITGVSGVYSELFRKFGTSFAISTILLIFSIVVVVIGLGMCFWYHRSIGMFYGALGVFNLSAWLITNSYLYPYVFGHLHIDGIINYLLCLSLPFGLILYLDSVQNGRYRKCLSILLLLTAVNAILWTVLHFTEIFAFNRALLYIDIILGALVAVIVVLLVIDFKHGYTKQYKYTFIGFIGFIFFCFLEIILLTFFTLQQDDLPMLIGLMFLLVFIVIQQVEDIRLINIEKQRAIDLSDAKTKFLANMSHEIRTPINAILGMNEMILRENKDKTIKGYAQNVRSSGRMLLMLVNDVLDFSKIEAGKLEITDAEYSLSNLLSEILTMFSERARFKNLEFLHEITAQVPDGQISDDVRIRQILVNLISNAIKYTDKGSVTLAIGGKYTDDDHFDLELSIRDTGRGIKEEEVENLFDAFSRADLKKNRNIEGTGLGLAIVKSILDSMGGSITVSSIYGVGSSFNVKIPVKVTDRTPVSDSLINTAHETKNDRKCDYTAPSARVLAVDDNHSNLTIVKLFLKETGIVPDLCNNGNAAIELCRKNKYDLILLDHMMPSPDGIETLAAIRNGQDTLNKETPAIVLTANAIAGSRQMYLDAGFEDYLTKPLDANELEMTVRRFLPKEKIILAGQPVDNSDSTPSSDDDFFVEEYLPIDDEETIEEAAETDLRERLGAIKGLDYDAALYHCAGEESVLVEILLEIAKEGDSRIKRMRKSVLRKDYDSYMIDAHAIKGLMATAGLEELSAYARQHESAARDKDFEFIEKNYETLINEYFDVCAKLKSILRE
ncbi:MAG: response regulator [Lachnospiraceae bacterium]|nr:response regulator [Lachnospiraceae bacterium]